MRVDKMCPCGIYTEWWDSWTPGKNINNQNYNLCNLKMYSPESVAKNLREMDLSKLKLSNKDDKVKVRWSLRENDGLEFTQKPTWGTLFTLLTIRQKIDS